MWKWICPKCKKEFSSKEEAREHIKSKHPEIIKRILSEIKAENLRGDPENWAAGVYIAWSQKII